MCPGPGAVARFVLAIGEERSIESIGEGFLKLFMEETAQIYGSFCESSSNVGAGDLAGLEGWTEAA